MVGDGIPDPDFQVGHMLTSRAWTASEGITIDFIGFLNEPEYAPSYSSMLSNGAQSASFIPILHSAIQAAGLKTGITCCDAEGWSDQQTYTTQIGSAGALQ